MLATAALLIWLLAVSACSSGTAEPITVSGDLTYSGSTAIPANATARVSIFEHSEDGGDKRIVAERSLHDLGKKPIRFDIDVARNLIDPEGEYGLRAEIMDGDGNILWNTVKAPRIKPLEGRDSLSLMLRPASQKSRLEFHPYRCDDGFRLKAAVTEDEATVHLGNRRLVLAAVSRSTNESEFSDEHGNTLSLKDKNLTLRVDSEQHRNCLMFVEQLPTGEAGPGAAIDAGTNGSVATGRQDTGADKAITPRPDVANPDKPTVDHSGNGSAVKPTSQAG